MYLAHSLTYKSKELSRSTLPIALLLYLAMLLDRHYLWSAEHDYGKSLDLVELHHLARACRSINKLAQVPIPHFLARVPIPLSHSYFLARSYDSFSRSTILDWLILVISHTLHFIIYLALAGASRLRRGILLRPCQFGSRIALLNGNSNAGLE
jgi:hypothetical protein